MERDARDAREGGRERERERERERMREMRETRERKRENERDEREREGESCRSTVASPTPNTSEGRCVLVVLLFVRLRAGPLRRYVAPVGCLEGIRIQ